ncbi:hypothetical protein FNH07_14255 [Amycolatopsis bartoniae]|nr:hypothetical protein FNH07_14255 [Amycolatopsis bartoniae]
MRVGQVGRGEPADPGVPVPYDDGFHVESLSRVWFFGQRSRPSRCACVHVAERGAPGAAFIRPETPRIRTRATKGFAFVHLAILVYDEVTLLDVADPAEVFKEANRFGTARRGESG